MKRNPKRKRSLQRLIISSKNRHRGGTHLYIYSHGGDGEQFPVAAVALYPSLSKHQAQFPRPRPFFTAHHPPRPTSHSIHLFFFEISYEGEYRRWKPLIVFGCFCLAVWLMSVGRELFKWI